MLKDAKVMRIMLIKDPHDIGFIRKIMVSCTSQDAYKIIEEGKGEVDVNTEPPP